MNNSLKGVILTKTFLYASSVIGMAEMLSSKDGIVGKMLAVACLISLTLDLQTW